jgi:PAS domain S-box-containing protein
LLESKEQLLETRLKDVWEKLIDGYVSIDKESKIIYANQAFISLFNLRESEVSGRSLEELIPELSEKSQDFNIALQQTIDTGEVQKRICFFRDKDVWINAAFFPTDEGIDVYMQDISSAERLRNAMNDLSFMTSHELRHEYAKLHSVINLMSVAGEDEKYLLKEAHKSLIQINSLISVMNDKLTFNRDNSIRAGDKDVIEFDEVVLIDDDHVINFINARVIRLLFDSVKVKSFSQAEKALDYLRESDKEGRKLIFIDLNMPGFDGWDFLESYQKLQVKSRIYILTSSINPRDIERSMDYKEVVKFLTKPLSVELLEYERIRPLAGSKAG